MDVLGPILTTRQQQLGLLCSGAVTSTAEYDSCGVANLPHSASSARQSFLQLVAARSQCMTQATVIPLYFQNTSFRSLEGHSQIPSSLPHLSACQIICFKRGKDNFFFFDNSVLNIQTDKVRNRSHIAFCLHRRSSSKFQRIERVIQGSMPGPMLQCGARAMGRKREVQLKIVFMT